MTVRAYDTRSWEEFRKNFKKQLDPFVPPWQCRLTYGPHIQAWADVRDTDPVPREMFRDFDSHANLAVLLRRGAFMVGNLYLVFDDDVIKENGIILDTC